MKKFTLSIALSLLFGLSVANAQNQKMVLLECFTSATCGPCASVNPTLDNLITNNESSLVAVKYHVNWPSDHDPMNQDNPSDVSSKVSYYGVNSVPMSVANGTWINNSGSVSQSLINQWAALETPLEMRMTHYLNEAQDSIFIVVMGRTSSAIESDGLKLNVSVIEKTMTYASAPGTNGERIFHNVMKKMLPGPAGQSISSLDANEYFAYKFSWALDYVMDINELSAVAWLQDYGTKEVYQACKSSADFQPFFQNQAVISGIDHIKNYICSGSVSPNIEVTNFGSATINNMVIKVYQGSVEVATINWEGNLPSMMNKTISLGDLNVDVDADDDLDIIIETVNGAADDYASSVFEYDFEQAEEVVNKSFKLTIRTDDNPQNITWDVINTETGDVAVSGGPYEEANHNYTENFDLEDNACYMFTIYDAGGDGLAGSHGVYGLKAGSKTLFAGSDFKDKESNEFNFFKQTGVAEESENQINIYPNPSTGVVTIDAEGYYDVAVYNVSGQLVKKLDVNGKTNLNLSNVEKGVYMLVMKSQDGKSNKQMIVLE